MCKLCFLVFAAWSLVVTSGIAAAANHGPAAMLAGDFNNQAQVETLPDNFSRVPARTGAWLDFQSAGFHRLTGTSLEGEVVYLQWHSADDSISRQRLWVFHPVDNETVAMDFYALRAPADWQDLHKDAQRQAALSLDDLVSYPAGCTLSFRRIPSGWAGALNPETCSIVTQQSKKEMTLESWIVITDDEVWYRERGQFPDGRFAFVVPGEGHYEFRRR